MSPVSIFAEVISSPEPHDFSEGLIDDQNIIKSINMHESMYDNDLDTREHIAQATNLEFTQPVYIEEVFLKTSGYSRASFIAKYIDGSSETVDITYNMNIEGYFDVNLDDVIAIEFESDLSGYLYEIDFFGSYEMDVNDRDGDGIPDHEDPYPDDPTNTPPDSDGDGIPDDEDEYPNDRDNDGIPDDEDLYPDNPENKQPEVKNLTVEAEPGRVDLYWENPDAYFEKAIIYRRDLGTVSSNLFKPMTVHAAEEFTPIFETNGTEFSDLTVSENEEYEYKVTTMYQGNESEGVTITTVVPEPPLIDFSETNIPFSIVSLLETIMNLILLLGPFILLSLAILFLPKLITLIRKTATVRSRGR